MNRIRSSFWIVLLSLRSLFFRDDIDRFHFDEHSTPDQLAISYPSVYEFFQTMLGRKLSRSESRYSLSELSEEMGLMPPRMIFAELQLFQHVNHIERLAADQALLRLSDTSPPTLVDVRQDWEKEIAPLPLAIDLREITPHHRDLILVCHHGIRSFDIAMQIPLTERRTIAIVRGGTEALSALDTRFKSYEAPPCE